MSDALCWPGKSKLPLRNVCQFYAKQNQNRKSLSFSSFHPSSVPASFWNKRTNKIYDPLRTARLHENEEEKKNRKKMRKKTMNCRRRNEETSRWPWWLCVRVSKWVLWFKWFSTFFSFLEQKKNWGNCQRPKQSSISRDLLLSYVWHACGSYNMALCSRRRRRHTKSNDTTGQTVVSSFSNTLRACVCVALAAQCASIISPAPNS